MFNTGIDIGSTTIKVVITDKQKNIVFSEYVRHNTDVSLNMHRTLVNVLEKFGDVVVTPVITGSVGMGVAEKLNMPFVQEVIASGEVIERFYPERQLFIDIGGEDAKLMYFRKNGYPDIRMNGNCAGGTGAFIDQMASLLGISLNELDELALQSDNIYPIASRCGVFAKTDIQSLLSKRVPLPDLARSVFHAVAVQVANTLLQGIKPKPKIIFSGGPLMFSRAMQHAMMHVLDVNHQDVIIPGYGNVLPALGACLAGHVERPDMTVSQLTRYFSSIAGKTIKNQPNRLKSLFKNKDEFKQWEKSKDTGHHLFEQTPAITTGIYIGIDAGSSTTKLVAVNQNKKIVFTYYTNNKGNTINAVKKAFASLRQYIEEQQINATIQYTIVTGYGEELIKKAFGCDEGIVETIAHFKAAAFFKSNVSFILDIGGQDIKAIYIKDGQVKDIEVNEACSSGCGTFIETFAGSLGLTVEEFSEKAVISEKPYNLGSRCTVFMNSKLKQALREGAKIEDISAGLAYAVVKNCFNKVLKVKDTNDLGDEIVVQGGTFMNPAVLKATEIFLGKQVERPPISALMGAFGCALTAIERTGRRKQGKSQFNKIEELEGTEKKLAETFICDGCGNKCRISQLFFPAGRVYYSGNRCEKKYSNNKQRTRPGFNSMAFKNKLVFEQKINLSAIPKFKIGILRVLNMYDNFSFWNVLFSELNIQVCLSSHAAGYNQQKVYGTIMSDNICYPAKLVHAHVFDLIDKQVDRIFYPIVRYEKNEFKDAVNVYNCPVVTGYPDVIKNVVNFEEYGVVYDMITVAFNHDTLLAKACYDYLKQFGIEKAAFQKAFKQAKARTEYIRKDLQEQGKKIIEQARANNKPVIMLVGRPYHADPAVHHNIPGMICDMGIDVITEDMVPETHSTDFKHDVHVLSQWQYSNRIYHALEWAGRQDNVHVIQLNSFGCGPDAVVMDEAKEIMEKYNKHYTMIRIDEGENPAPVKLRIRSLVESLHHNYRERSKTINIRQTTPSFCKIDRKKRILGPNLSQFYALFTESLFFQEGYDFELLPEADRQSVETGLKYVNNDICYPAIILIGDIIKALQSGKYDLKNVAIAMSETGGQCRASNYVSLIKKAMLDAGYKDIPVISVSTNPNTLNVQPGFKKNFFELLSLTLNTLIYTDALLKLYNYLVVREKTKGESKRIFDKYIQYAYQNRRNYVIKHSLRLLKQAVDEFNAIAYHDVSLPRAGIVGEIFMKYNSFGNYQLEDWLRNNGMEVVASPINPFFLESLADIKFNNANNLEKDGWIEQMFHEIIEQRVDRYINKVNAILKGFHHCLTPLHNIDELQKNAREIVSLAHQYGEGWLLPAEMVTFAKEGIHNIVAVQPFGCVACHIVSKGVSKRIKDMFPELNVLFLDMDADTSEANMHNRLEFFVRNAFRDNDNLRNGLRNEILKCIKEI